MDTNTDVTVNKPLQTKEPTRRSKLRALAVLLILLLATGGVYFWQDSKIKDLNSQLSGLNDMTKKQGEEILSQAAQIADLEDQVAATQSDTPVVEDATPDLGVTIKSASRIGSIYGGNSYIAVTVSVKNSGSTSAALDLTSFKLTDTDNNKYQSLREQQSSTSDYNYVLSILDLPKNSTLLTTQTVNKGETVAGTLVFYANNSLSDFTLSYQGVDQSISLD